MNILRATLITLLVTAASLGALLIPLESTTNAQQTPSAAGATISLVDSLPSVQATIPSVPEQPKTTRVKTESVTAPASTPTPSIPLQTGEKPPPISANDVAVTKATGEPEVTIDPDPEVESSPNSETLPIATEYPAQGTMMQSDTEASFASVAVSTVLPDPLPSLVDGHYEMDSVDQGPSFDRVALASRIRYPDLAKHQGIEGLVVLRLYISPSGKVERIVVEEDPGYGLAQAAVQAFTGLQGKPAVLGGKAVGVTLRYPVRFSLE